jgi:hypothetical protein
MEKRHTFYRPLLFSAHCGGNLGRRLGKAVLGRAHVTDSFSSPSGSGFWPFLFLSIFRFFNTFLFSLFERFEFMIFFQFPTFLKSVQI